MAAKRISSVVSTHWLKALNNSNSRNHRILDTSWSLKKSGAENFQQEHIPGALFFDLNRCVNPLPYLPRNLPNAACFTEYAQTLGISSDTHVILYDRSNMLPAARAWWNFKAYGHDNVSVLDGGLKKWLSEEESIENGPMALPEKMGNFTVNIRREFITDFDDLKEIIKNKSHQIIDARSSKHFSGMEAEPLGPTKSAYIGLDLKLGEKPRVGGHIPGSINMPEDDLLNESKCLQSENTLREVFKSFGIDMTKPMATMCYNGNAACLIALAANVCGQDDVTVYYGSWTEYGYRADANDVTTTSDTPPATGG